MRSGMEAALEKDGTNAKFVTRAYAAVASNKIRKAGLDDGVFFPQLPRRLTGMGKTVAVSNYYVGKTFRSWA